jgi:hypothetical protein
MGPLGLIWKQKFIMATLAWLIVLACSPLARWQEVDQQQTVTTKPTSEDENDVLNINKAYEKLQTLPGYRLESEHVVRDNENNQTTRETIINQYDSSGNAHILIQHPDGQQSEVYFVDGHTYIFETEYEGWVNLGAVPPTEIPQASDEVTLASLKLTKELRQRLTQPEGGPIKQGHEMLLDRSVTRYAITDTLDTLGQEPASPPIHLRGSLWVDDQTGAVIKSEMFLYENEKNLPIQELGLEVSHIGNVPPITVPTPVVDPTAMAAATATATALVQTVLPAKLNYQGQPVDFEIVPLRVKQVPDSSPRSGEVRLVLRQLPDSLFQEASFEPFLAQLRERLTLSIPERNLIITSSGFRLEERDSKNRTLEVLYFFNADLEDLRYVELILSGQGNPIFAPVPVE